MFVDCLTCPVRGLRCDDCAVTVLGAPPSAGHRALTGPQLSAGPQFFAGRAWAAEPAWTAEPSWFPEPVWTPRVPLDTPGFQLDAAEFRVVSMFVGAGLVNAGAAAQLLARRERVPSWENAREVC